MIATNATEVYIGRILSGFSAGGSINLIVLFVTELADDKWVIWNSKYSLILTFDAN